MGFGDPQFCGGQLWGAAVVVGFGLGWWQPAGVWRVALVLGVLGLASFYAAPVAQQSQRQMRLWVACGDLAHRASFLLVRVKLWAVPPLAGCCAVCTLCTQQGIGRVGSVRVQYAHLSMTFWPFRCQQVGTIDQVSFFAQKHAAIYPCSFCCQHLAHVVACDQGCGKPHFCLQVSQGRVLPSTPIKARGGRNDVS